jgi:hypothetical protein
MKKISLLLLTSICVVFCLFSMSCSRKGFASAPPDYGNDTQFVPFTKSLKIRLERDGVDIRKIQFYVDQTLILKHSDGSEKGRVEAGVILLDHSDPLAITVPEYTPGVCEKVNGDNLMISFDAPGKCLEFGTLYANNAFMLIGSNWRNGIVEVTYDGQPYTAACSSCNNVGEIRLLVRKNQTYTKDDKNRVVLGRRVN